MGIEAALGFSKRRSKGPLQSETLHCISPLSHSGKPLTASVSHPQLPFSSLPSVVHSMKLIEMQILRSVQCRNSKGRVQTSLFLTSLLMNSLCVFEFANYSQEQIIHKSQYFSLCNSLQKTKLFILGRKLGLGVAQWYSVCCAFLGLWVQSQVVLHAWLTPVISALSKVGYFKFEASVGYTQSSRSICSPW